MKKPSQRYNTLLMQGIRSRKRKCWSSLPPRRLFIDHAAFLKKESRLTGQAMLETVVEHLVGLPEGDHVTDDLFRFDSLKEDARDEVGDGLHLGLAHAQPGNLDCPYAQPAGAVPVFRFVSRDQVLIGDDIGARSEERRVGKECRSRW